MKIRIESQSQAEFDEKRELLIKAIAGKKLKVDVLEAGQKRPNEAREPVYQSQAELLADWDETFRQMLKDLKRDIEGVL